MQFVPWRHIADWHCTSCGDCCRLYSVVINFHEWLGIVKNYGAGCTATRFDGLFIRRRGDGSCTFLSNFSSTYACGIQYMKPKACQTWPFKILTQAQFGCLGEAIYPYFGGDLYIYADPLCTGLKFGIPTWEFANETLKEFVEIAVGLRRGQHKTTARVTWPGNPVNTWDSHPRSYF